MKITQTKVRELSYSQAIREALDMSMAKDKSVVIIGEGVPDPKGIFGTTLGLREKYGRLRVWDMPVSENGVTGICVGAAISGLRPVMTHQRIDFSLLSCDQIINTAAKWYYMYGGKRSVPLVIRMVIGRGWGQGCQHSQSLQALYAHIPGLKVVMPASADDAKGMLISAIEDNNPVIFIEHRWLHHVKSHVPDRYYKESIGSAKIKLKGRDLTMAATSYMVLESIKASEILKKEGIEAEVIDIRSIKPLDIKTIVGSVKKTGRLLAADTGYKTLGVASELVAVVSRLAFQDMKSAPSTVTLPDIPTPTSWKEAEKYYPTYLNIVEDALNMMKFDKLRINRIIKRNGIEEKAKTDIPYVDFKGPF